MNYTEKQQALIQIRQELEKNFSNVENIGCRFYAHGTCPAELEELTALLENEFTIPIEIVILGPPAIFFGSDEHARKIMKKLYGWHEPQKGQKAMWHGQSHIVIKKEELEEILA